VGMMKLTVSKLLLPATSLFSSSSSTRANR
jgi:hypothetical protein